MSEPSALEPCTLVIFGASGDLTRRKLLPALFQLDQQGQLPPGFTIVGVSRRPFSDVEFREMMTRALQAGDDLPAGQRAEWDRFTERLFYQPLHFPVAADYAGLAARLETLSREGGAPENILFYLAAPPDYYEPIIRGLVDAGLNRRPRRAGGSRRAEGNHGGAGWTRIIVEKPFGRDQKTARDLNRILARAFAESEVYRMDHYLGKETVQNILVMRFANAIFEPVWNNRFIDHVQITAAEDIGIGTRAGYYEQAGVLRDMFQNHLLQLLCTVAMEPPALFEADSVRDERVKALRSVRPIRAADVPKVAVRGQYGPGLLREEPVPGYREEAGVEPQSTRETFAAVKFEIGNWRWQGVPFYLRSGKRLASKSTEVAIQFREVPHLLFRLPDGRPAAPNMLVWRIQPDETICLRLDAKRAGQSLGLQSVNLVFSPEPDPAERVAAYATLILDAMRGDRLLFSRADWIEAAWNVIDPIVAVWEKSPPPDFPNYPAGKWGPPEADALLATDGRAWRKE